MITAFLACTIAFAGTPVEEKSKTIPTGKWVKELGSNRVEFSFQPNHKLVCHMNVNNQSIKIHADYGISEKKFVFGRITKISSDGPEPNADVGGLFSFQFERNGSRLTISNINGGDGRAHDLLQGSYSMAKKK